ncbi:unnamed protein product [Caenorhabditis bovis]|uniref:RRM domain-containing protein n=1 Tax=Caenorhabditis bovis TaxID=2654633 RepID=A0A8S1F6E4_9PELO|nr:unnamed protein product [Caenorhabditis bovis]
MRFTSRLEGVPLIKLNDERGADAELQLALAGNAAAAGYYGMTADSEPKKAKLDPSLLYYSNPAYLTGVPFSQIQLSTLPQCTTSAATAAPRSKVVHVRNIPPDLLEVELLQLCGQYGQISNFMMLKGKSQAFVEYEEENGAAAFVTAMAAVPIQIRGRTVFAQFSTHKELKLDKNKVPTSSAASLAAPPIPDDTEVRQLCCFTLPPPKMG